MTAYDRVGPYTDRALAIVELAMENHRRRLARDQPADVEACREFAKDRLAVAFAAADKGHTVVWDPPAALTSIRARYTCVRCGHAVLQAAEGHLYGSAMDAECDNREVILCSDEPGINLGINAV